MSSCEDDLETALQMANTAIERLWKICPTDDLLKPILEPGMHPELWAQFRERFGDKSGHWNDQPTCANAVFWQNYAKAVNARADELELAQTQSPEQT